MKTWTEQDLAALDKHCDAVTNDTKKALATQPKVRLTIIDAEKKVWDGCINGHIIRIKTNKVVEVPRDIATLIRANARVIEESEKKLEPYRKNGGKKLEM